MRSTVRSELQVISREIVKANWEAADRIAASSDRVREEIEALRHAKGEVIERAERAFGAIGAAFEWGVEKLCYQLELQTSALQDILQVLQQPLATQAKELRERGMTALRNGWLDEALGDLEASAAANYQDFTVHQSLGYTHMGRGDLAKAAVAFQNAAKYAKPVSPYDAAIGLVHVARVKALQEDLPGAYEAGEEATKLCPSLPLTWWELAMHAAGQRKDDVILSALRTAIELEPTFMLKVWKEIAGGNKGLARVEHSIRALCADLREAVAERARATTAKLKELVERVLHLVHMNGDAAKRQAVLSQMEEVEQLNRRDSFFDYLRADEKAAHAWQRIRDIGLAHLSGRISGHEQWIFEAQAEAATVGGKSWAWRGVGIGFATYFLAAIIFITLLGVTQDLAEAGAMAVGVFAGIMSALVWRSESIGRAQRKIGEEENKKASLVAEKEALERFIELCINNGKL